MDIFLVIAKSLGMSLGVCAVVLFVLMAGMLFWVRRTIKGKTYCFFLGVNRQLTGKLLKHFKETIVVGSGEDAVEYITHSSKQFWSSWPPGLPSWVQEPVPTLLYVKGNAEPLDPFDRKSLISEEALMRISDEAMLKQTWKDVRESMGFRAIPKKDMLLVAMVLAAVVAGLAAAYFGYAASGQLDKVMQALGL